MTNALFRDATWFSDTGAWVATRHGYEAATAGNRAVACETMSSRLIGRTSRLSPLYSSLQAVDSFALCLHSSPTYDF